MPMKAHTNTTILLSFGLHNVSAETKIELYIVANLIGYNIKF